MVGNFSDVTTSEQRSKINHVTRWYKPWFYKHVETFLEKVTGRIENITIIPCSHRLTAYTVGIWLTEIRLPETFI